jgi:hypothetical protein
MGRLFWTLLLWVSVIILVAVLLLGRALGLDLWPMSLWPM